MIELIEFGFVQALKVKLELDDKRTHCGMAENRFPPAFSDSFVLCNPYLVVHGLLYHIIPYTENDFIAMIILKIRSFQQFLLIHLHLMLRIEGGAFSGKLVKMLPFFGSIHFLISSAPCPLRFSLEYRREASILFLSYDACEECRFIFIERIIVV